MSNSPRLHTVNTSHGTIAVEENGPQNKLPLLLIHGNSFCKEVFRHQLYGPLANRYRLIALDLPGHGQSGDALDYMRTYTRPGLADATVELLANLGITEAVVMGWSLGGHVAIDMINLFAGMRGLIITGAPPVGVNMAEGFNTAIQSGTAGKAELTQEDIDGFVKHIFQDTAESFMNEAVARADRRFRKRLFEGVREGLGANQRFTVESSNLPIAVINGSTDKIVKLDYFDTVKYGNLWESTCYRLANAGHASFWQTPTEFNTLLARFLKHIEKQ